MATILMGWELGSGLGHVKTLLSVGRELAKHGHEPVFALRNVVEAGPLLRDAGFPLLPVPVWPKPLRNKKFLAANFADILGVRGFGNADDLEMMVRTWQGLIEMVRPQLIVCDHSPTLCLTAHGGPTPLVLIGNGFTMPPIEPDRFTPLLSNKEPTISQERVLAVVREVQRRRGRPAPATLPAMLAGTARFIRTFPELDPYQAVRQEQLVGPIGPLPAPVPLPKDRAVFAYLSTDTKNLELIADALVATGFPCLVYIRGAGAKLREAARHKGLQVFDGPASLPEVLPRVSAILHESSLGTSEAGLASGRPQVVLPRDLEKQFIARALLTMGVSPPIKGKLSRQSLTLALLDAVGNPRYATQAVAWSRKIAERGPCSALPQIVAKCLSLIDGSTSGGARA